MEFLKNKNKWKIAFFIILGVNFLIGIILLVMLMLPAGSSKSKLPDSATSNQVSFHVNSNKQDLNKLINHYLKEETSDSPIDYRVLLGNEVELYGTLPVFTQEIDMKLTFEPEVQNGDLVLNQKSISIGQLNLPISYVLKFIRDNYKLPKGVEIRPNDKLIYVNMDQLKLKSDIKIKANQFDLQKDNISFTILVPVN